MVEMKEAMNLKILFRLSLYYRPILIKIHIYLLLLAASTAFSQKNITVCDMKHNYYLRQKAEDETTKQNTDELDELDELVFSSYNYREYGELDNFRTHRRFICYVTKGLRTKQYPDRKHFWSMMIYYKRPYNQENRRKRRQKPFCSSIRYLVLDSIEGVNRSEWHPETKKNYCVPIEKTHYAKGISQTVFMQEMDLIDMMGFQCSPFYSLFEIKKGKIKNFCKSKRVYLMQTSELWSEDTTLDGNLKLHLQIAMRNFSKRINNLASIPHSNGLEGDYDLLIVLNQDGTADVEKLSQTEKQDLLFDDLRNKIKSLPPNYFFHLWTIDGVPLPGLYIKATYDKKKWTFSMSDFIL